MSNWRRAAVTAAGVWLGTRVAYAVFTYFSFEFGAAQPAGPALLLEAWGQWDTHWYELISRLGYFSPPSVAFLPLYPALVAAVSALVGDAGGPVYPAIDDLRLAVALVVANLGSLVGFFGLALLAESEGAAGDHRLALRTLLLLSAFPFAFYFAAGYAEGPFLAAATFSLYFARRGRWWASAVAAFLAALTRPNAIALLPALTWEFGRQRRWWTGAWVRPSARGTAEAAAVLGAMPLAIAGFAAYNWARFGSPLVFLRVSATDWHRQLSPPWLTAARLIHRLVSVSFFSPQQAALLLELVPVVAFVAVVLVAGRRLPFAFTLYVLGLVALALAAPVPTQYELIVSAGRHMAVAFPVFMVLAGWLRDRPGLAAAWIASGFVLQAALLAVFLRGGWVA
jgi:hypothetical protein